MNTFDHVGLMPSERLAMCWHEAGHAVVHALGGQSVERVEVAPTGSTNWWTTTPGGRVLTDIWGVCCLVPTPVTVLASAAVHWRPGDSYGADRTVLRRMMGAFPPRQRRAIYRELRALVGGVLAGPIAEDLHRGIGPTLGEADIFAPAPDDWGLAEVTSWLLPFHGELHQLWAVTLETLQQPQVWRMVGRLATELDRTGLVTADELAALLPAPCRDWPPSPRARHTPSLVVVAPSLARRAVDVCTMAVGGGAR